MQYDIEESGLSVTMTAANFDVAVTACAPLEVAVGECARIDVGEAVNYIKSGQAEIGAAVDIGVNRIASSVTDGISDFNLNALNKSNAFNGNVAEKTGDFDAHAAIKKAEIDADVALAKQWAIGEPTEPAGYSAKYWADNAASATAGLAERVTTIENDIPAQASSSNQLADKSFVNSSIATNTANFIGTFNSVAELEAYSGQKDDNDYAFVVSTDAAGNTVYNRYKWNGTAWLFEYALNNSSFTANQWAAINSGATTANIGQIATKADDNAVVHKTGNETIAGTKTFQSQTLNQSSTSTSEGTHIDFVQEINNARRGTLRTMYNNDGSYSVMLGNNGPDASSPAGITVIRNATKTWAEAPSTPDIGDNSRKLATTAFVATAVNNLLSSLYPVGSIYIGTQSTCPLATLISGSTWVKVSEGRVLQGSDSNHNAGTTIEAGLPNITGNPHANVLCHQNTSDNDEALGYVYGGTAKGWGTSSGVFGHFTLDASRSSSIYGNSNTVQPPAYVVNIWRRTA